MVCSSVVVPADTPQDETGLPPCDMGAPHVPGRYRQASSGSGWPTAPPGSPIGVVTSRSEHDPAVCAALLPRDPAAREVLRQIASHRETAALLDARARRSIQPAQGRQLANRAAH